VTKSVGFILKAGMISCVGDGSNLLLSIRSRDKTWAAIGLNILICYNNHIGAGREMQCLIDFSTLGNYILVSLKQVPWVEPVSIPYFSISNRLEKHSKILTILLSLQTQSKYLQF